MKGIATHALIFTNTSFAPQRWWMISYPTAKNERQIKLYVIKLEKIQKLLVELGYSNESLTFFNHKNLM